MSPIRRHYPQTPIPNELLDSVAKMTPEEFIVLLVLHRRAYEEQGWGFVISDRQLQAKTMLSLEAVRAGVRAAVRDGWISPDAVAEEDEDV